MIYEARRLDTGETLPYEDDPELVVGRGETFHLILGTHKVLCERVFEAPQVVASDRRKRFNDAYENVRSDGRLSSMQLPTKEQCLIAGKPLAPYYNGNDEPSFMTRDQASEYAKKLNDADPSGGYAYDA